MRKKTALAEPPTIGQLADQLYTLRTKRLAQEKKAETMREQERALEQQALVELQHANLTKASGRKATISRTTRTAFSVVDWDATLGWIRKRRAWDLLHRRVAQEAARARIENGVSVPGLDAVHTTVLSITKVSR
jgi:hypothetical protein